MSFPVLPVAIFAITFFLIFTERINRTLAALLGGFSMVAFGVITGGEALASIEFTAISSIIGILILVSVVRSSGLFAWLAIKVVKLSKGNPAKLMVALSLLSAFVASFLGGTATILIMGGLIVTICKQLNLKVPPYLMASALMTSVGGGFFLTGSSINILLSNAGGFSFIDFFSNSLPISLLLGIITSLFFVWYFKIENKESGEILLDEKQAITDWKKFWITMALLSGTIFLFIISGFVGLTVEMIAIGSGILALLLTGFEPEKAFREVQWETLFFLIGVFVVMGGLEKSGVFHAVASVLAPIVKGDSGRLLLIGIIGPISGIVHSLPITVALIPIVKEIVGITGELAGPIFWTLILAINFGENLTPLGSTSSILAMGIGKTSGQPVSFAEFLKIGAILCAIHLTIAGIWVFFRY
ncbi:MAG: SLC13 family permease [archaeon]